MPNLDRFDGYPDMEQRRPPRYEPDYMQAAKERTEERLCGAVANDHDPHELKINKEETR